MKGQLNVMSVISVLILLIVVALGFMPLYKDMVANHTAGWTNSETLIFSSLGIILILAIILSLLSYTQGSRQQVYYQ